MKILLKRVTLLPAVLLVLMMISPVLAQGGSVIFIIDPGSTYMGGSGWFAGYVISGSGTYDLNISATGSLKDFPMTSVKVIVLASNEAAGGGLKSLLIEGIPIIGFNHTINPKTGRAAKPSYYIANGGPFQEPDYYGYNDTYVIAQLTFSEAHHPDNSKQITTTVEFGPTATINSKIAFLCYGIDAKNNPAETPFSGGTMFAIPDLGDTLMGLIAFAGAYGVHNLRKYRKLEA